MEQGEPGKKTPNNRGAASKNYMGKTKITIAPQLYINLVWILPCKIVLLQNHSHLYYSEFSIHHVWPQAVGFVRHKAKFSWTLSDDQLLHLHLWDMHYKSTWRLIYHGIWYFTRFKISIKLNQQNNNNTRFVTICKHLYTKPKSLSQVEAPWLLLIWKSGLDFKN